MLQGNLCCSPGCGLTKRAFTKAHLSVCFLMVQVVVAALNQHVEGSLSFEGQSDASPAQPIATLFPPSHGLSGTAAEHGPLHYMIGQPSLTADEKAARLHSITQPPIHLSKAQGRCHAAPPGSACETLGRGVRLFKRTRASQPVIFYPGKSTDEVSWSAAAGNTMRPHFCSTCGGGDQKQALHPGITLWPCKTTSAHDQFMTGNSSQKCRPFHMRVLDGGKP